MTDPTCGVSDCESPAREVGYCWRHWAQWSGHGDPLSTRRFYRNDHLRLLSLVCEDAETECWNWLADVHVEKGYGYSRYRNVRMVAHRAVYLELVGPIPDDLTLDHLCRNRQCVNPGHMDVVPGPVNTLRGFGPTAENARKTHCIRGHEFTAANTIPTERPHWRRCRECERARGRRRSARASARRAG